jgi:hypothetical protein
VFVFLCDADDDDDDDEEEDDDDDGLWLVMDRVLLMVI